jgi:hypothetical protein
VFGIDHTGISKNYDTPGYWAIGSGAYLAFSALLSRRQNTLTTVVGTVYHACEAKFSAEHALGVGKTETFVVIKYTDGLCQSISNEDIAQIKAKLEAEAQPKYPENIGEYIAVVLHKTPRSPFNSAQ